MLAFYQKLLRLFSFRMAIHVASLLVLLLGGCSALQPRVRNPYPNVFRVAVLPFNDLTPRGTGVQQGLNTAELTSMFASELQQIPTFEVLPTAQVEYVMNQHRLGIFDGSVYRVPTSQPELVQSIARLLDVDAVLVGDVLEYQVDYPLRLGVHVEFYTGEQSKPIPESAWKPTTLDISIPIPELKCPIVFCTPSLGKLMPHGRRQCADPHPHPKEGDVKPNESSDSKSQSGSAKPGTNSGKPSKDNPKTTIVPVGYVETNHGHHGAKLASNQPAEVDKTKPDQPPEPTGPFVLRHTRVFDGANRGLTERIRDYQHFREDRRAGDYRGYLLRSEDFMRYCAQRTLIEMLESAGGKWLPLQESRLLPLWPWPWR